MSSPVANHNSDPRYEAGLELLKNAEEIKRDLQIIEKEIIRLRADTQKLTDKQHLAGILHHISKFP